MTFEKKCVVCGKAFTTEIANRNTCCEGCAATRAQTLQNERRRGVHEVRTAVCVVCGKKFVVRHNTGSICSKACKRKRNREYRKTYRTTHPIKRLLKKCAVCGHEFDPKSNHQLYCSHECRLSVAREHERKYRNAHPDKCRAYHRKYKRTAAGKASSRRYFLSHKEKFARRSRTYYWKNHEEVIKKQSERQRARLSKGRSDLENGVVSKESLYYIKSRIRAEKYRKDNLEKWAGYQKRYRYRKGAEIANGEIDAAWRSVGIFD